MLSFSVRSATPRVFSAESTDDELTIMSRGTAAAPLSANFPAAAEVKAPVAVVACGGAGARTPGEAAAGGAAPERRSMTVGGREVEEDAVRPAGSFNCAAADESDEGGDT